MENRQIPLSHALTWFTLSILMISGPFALWHFNYDSDSCPITKIVQSTSSNLFLKSFVLADLLDLSCDDPTPRAAFSLEEAERRLRSTPIIQEATLSFLEDDTLIVDYELRQPVAFLGGWENVAVDREGALFPFQPFFTPQRLTTIRLAPHEGLPLTWGMHLDTALWQEALSILTRVQAELPHELFLKELDISREKHVSKALREWILTLESREGEVMYVRTAPQAYTTLRKIKTLLPERTAERALIDLRFPHMALITALN